MAYLIYLTIITQKSNIQFSLDQYNFINHVEDVMSRMLKDPKSIGKLSTHKMSPFQPSMDKKVSAILPIRQKNKKNRLSLSALVPEGKQDPLPYIKTGSKPLKMKRHSLKNPENEVGYVDGNKRKISHCIAIQMDSPRHSKAGKLYNPSLEMFNTPGKIKHQPQSQVKSKKQLNQSNINNFKNFLQHKYVQEVMQKRKGVTLIEYDRKFKDSVGSTAQIGKIYLTNTRYEQQKQILPVCSEGESKSFYLSTSFIKLNETYIKDAGDNFITCLKEQLSVPQCQNDFQANQSLLINCPNQQTISLYMQTSISRIKQILIQQQSHIYLSFQISKPLKEPLCNLATQGDIHTAVNQIFNNMANFKPQLISLKKFVNCILLVAKSPFNPEQSFALLWYFNGSFYFGQWQSSGQTQGKKSRKGIEYLANQYIYFGQHENNKRCGYGIMKKLSGQIYVGQWSNGQRNGWGKVFQENGTLSLDGNFQGDNFVGNRLQSRLIV